MEKFIDYIAVIKNEWDEYLKKSLLKYNITYGEFNGIEVLDTEEKLSSNILAGRMNLSPSRASRVIENMVRKKVLIRDIDCTDRRKCTIELTEMGVEIKNKVKKIKSDFFKLIMKGLDQKEVDEINNTLRKMIKSL